MGRILGVFLLGICLAAGDAHAASAEALFLEGSSANRAARFEDAAKLLRAAEAAGYRAPELQFELGWSAMGGGNWEECVARLERYEQAAPGRGQTSEFLGRCHLALRRIDRAETLLKQALERDPRLAPTVNLSLASIEEARGNSAAARTRLASAESADTPTGRALRDLAGPPDPVIQPDQPLRLSLSFTGGHNSNVIALGNTIPLPTDISNKAADYARLAFGASYTQVVAPETTLAAGYALLVDRYDGLESADLNDHFVYVDLFHQASKRMALSLRLSGEFTELARSRFRNSFGLRPALSYRFDDYSVTELAYNYADNDYKGVTAPQFNRDGSLSSLGITHSLRIPGTRWSGAVSASINRSNTDGNDFASDGYGASATVRYTFANRVVAAIGVAASRDDYRNLNSLAGAGFEFARKDRQNSTSAQLSGPLTDKLRWFIHGQALRNKSNIAFYEYKQNVFSAGLAADF
jgi:tetratricopeptide (TPR) repeat protein